MIDKAREHFRSAELLLANNLFRDAVSRAYYAIYSAIHAIIGDPPKGSRWKHHGIREAIVKLLHEEGQDEVGEKLNEDIGSIYQMRVVADYRTRIIDEEVAGEVVNKARNILNWVEGRLAE